MNDELKISYFDNLNGILSLVIKNNVLFDSIDSESLEGEIDDLFTSYDNKFVLNVKMNKCYSSEKDIIDQSKFLQEMINKDNTCETLILSKLENFIEKYDFLYDYIKYERESMDSCFNDFFDPDYFKKAAVESYGNNDIENAKIFAEKMLEDSLLKVSVNTVSIESDCYIGNSGGYFAPLSSDFFESFIQELSDFNYEYNELKNELEYLFDSCDISCDLCISEKDSNILNADSKLINIFNCNDKEKDIVINSIESKNDPESFFREVSRISNEMKSLHTYASELFKEYNNNKESLLHIFKYAKELHDSSNTSQSFAMYIVNTFEFEDVINYFDKKSKDTSVKPAV